MYECSNCGGELRYNIKQKKLKCTHCDQFFDPEEFEKDLEVKEQDLQDMKLLTCPVCGGEVTSANLSAMTKCRYCGSTVVMQVKNGSMKRPDRILPFEVTKERCINAFKEKAKAAVFAPGALQNEEFLQDFQGIYMPFHCIHTEMKNVLHLKGEKTSRQGKDDVIRTFNLDCTLDDPKQDIYLDASSSFRDSVSREIMPYHFQNERKFSPAYMLGFYADQPDVPAGVYDEDAKELVSEAVFLDVAKHSKKVKGYDPDIPKIPEDIAAQCGTRVTGSALSMLPVWFLTWRHRNRVSYAVVNGQTGEVAAEFPIDYVKFFVTAAVAAVVSMVLLHFFAAMTAPAALTWILVLSTAILFGSWHQIRRLVIHSEYLDDRGHFGRGGPDTQGRRFVKQSRTVEGSKGLIDKAIDILFSVALDWIVFLFVLAFAFLDSDIFSSVFRLFPDKRALLLMIATAMIIYVMARSIMFLVDVNRVEDLFAIAGPLAGCILSITVLALRPAEDWAYYSAAIVATGLCLFGMLLMIFRYNLLVTNPVPHLFERQREEMAAAGDVRANFNEKGVSIALENEKRLRRRKVLRWAYLVAFFALIALAVGVAMKAMDNYNSRKAAQAEAYKVSEMESTSEVDGVPLYTNPTTGYHAYIQDYESLLSDEEREKLVNDMAPVTAFGHVAFVSAKVRAGDTAGYAEEYFLNLFGPTDGTLFLIDMYNRQIYIYSGQSVYKVITKSKANSITDNVYKYASKEDYYTCAAEVFRQMSTLLLGGTIAEPMKRICDILVGILLGLGIAYLLVLFFTDSQSLSAADIAGVAAASVAVASVHRVVTSEKRRRHVSSGSGGSGGGGGGFSGGGGGGGGFSGGGGGHGF